MVVDYASREGGQDRREGHQSRPLHSVPDGRSGRATQPIQAHTGHDRRTATKAGRAMLNPKAGAAVAIEELDGRTVSEVVADARNWRCGVHSVRKR